MGKYKCNKKMLKKGQILDRGENFYLFGYEYTFRNQSDVAFMENYVNWFTENIKGRLKYSHKKEQNTLVVVGFDFKFEMALHRREGENAMYHVFFSRWMENLYDVSEADYMNMLLTGLEFMIVRADPLAWVRDMWVPRSIIGHQRTYEIWDTKYPEYRLTPEDIKAKGCNNGRPFEELYLADRLRGYGAEVYGGSAVSPAGKAPVNPLVALERNEAKQKMDAVKEAEEAKKIEAAKPKYCPACGQEAAKGTRFCAGCGAKFELTREEKKAEERTLKEFPMFFLNEACEEAEPYLYVNLDEELNPIPESSDGALNVYQLAGFDLSRSLDGEKGFSKVYDNISGDNYMYLTDSKLMIINKKYNKNEAGSWVGFGGISAYLVAETLTAAGKAVKAAQRRGKALAGQLRYEWISNLRFKEKKGILSYPSIELYYKDLNKTTWCLTIYLKGDENVAFTFADYLLHKTAIQRLRMDDTKDEEMTAFLTKYSDLNQHIPMPAAQGEFSGVKIPVYYFATKGKPFCPWYF